MPDGLADPRYDRDHPAPVGIEASDWRTLVVPVILEERISKCRSNFPGPPISGYKNALRRTHDELPMGQCLRVGRSTQGAISFQKWEGATFVEYMVSCHRLGRYWRARIDQEYSAFLIDTPSQAVLGDHVLPSNLADISRTVTVRRSMKRTRETLIAQSLLTARLMRLPAPSSAPG